MKNFIGVGLALFCLGSAMAEGTGQGEIAKIEHGPVYGTKVFFTIQGAVSGQPTCKSSLEVYQFVFDAGAPGGKEILASLYLAKSTGQSVKVSGYGVCSLQGGIEDLRWIRLE